MNVNTYENIKNEIENEIQQLKLKLYEKQFKLSEIKNAIRKNCNHEWRYTDIEMGNTSLSEMKCIKCNETAINNNLNNIYI